MARIPRSVTSLSDEAFNWFAPEEVFIPSQITYIGPWTFATWIDRVYLESPVPPFFDSQNGQLNIINPGSEGFSDPEIYVLIGSHDDYARADGWRQFDYRIREFPVAPSPRLPLYQWDVTAVPVGSWILPTTHFQ